MIDSVPEHPGEGTIRVVCWNLHHGTDRQDRASLDLVADRLAAWRPDLVALQEVDRNWSERSDHADQLELLAERLGLQAAFGAALDRPASTPGGRPQYGNAVLSRTPLTDVRGVRFPWDGSERRAYVVATTEILGTQLRLVCTHLSVSASWRRWLQSLLLRLRFRRGLPTIVAGDLNAQQTTAPIRLLRPVGRDTLAEMAERTAPPDPALTDPRRIDYVLASGPFEVHAAARPPVQASDHLPLVVDLKVR